jgi:hypothetical protein
MHGTRNFTSPFFASSAHSSCVMSYSARVRPGPPSEASLSSLFFSFCSSSIFCAAMA